MNGRSPSATSPTTEAVLFKLSTCQRVLLSSKRLGKGALVVALALCIHTDAVSCGTVTYRQGKSRFPKPVDGAETVTRTSIRNLAKETEFSRNTIKRHLRALVADGWGRVEGALASVDELAVETGFARDDVEKRKRAGKAAAARAAKAGCNRRGAPDGPAVWFWDMRRFGPMGVRQASPGEREAELHRSPEEVRADIEASRNVLDVLAKHRK
jgi:hypothetical protein